MFKSLFFGSCSNLDISSKVAMEALPTTLSEDQIINKEADTGNKPAGVLDIFESLPKEVPSSEDMDVVEVGYNLSLFFGSSSSEFFIKGGDGDF